MAALLGTSCGTSTCHDGTDHVNLHNDAGLYARIVNASPTGAKTMAQCTSRKLIVPNDVTNSVIAQVIMAKLTGCTNARMPDECPSMRAVPDHRADRDDHQLDHGRRADVSASRRVGRRLLAGGEVDAVAVLIDPVAADLGGAGVHRRVGVLAVHAERTVIAVGVQRRVG